MAPTKSNHDLEASDAAQQVEIENLKEAFDRLPRTLWKIAGVIGGVITLLTAISGTLVGIWLHVQDERLGNNERRFERIEIAVNKMATDFSDLKADAAVIKAQITPIEEFRARLRALEATNKELESELKHIRESHPK